MILRQFMRAKIHRATVTEANLEYIGSITVDSSLLAKVGMSAGELVHVWNITNGSRLETYIIEGAPGSGVICINGAGAHLMSAGDQVIIAAFALADEPVTAKVILVDDKNRFERYISSQPGRGY
jgi:aspartate 1-decarboxylase